jgi:hypothetical protein
MSDQMDRQDCGFIGSWAIFTWHISFLAEYCKRAGGDCSRLQRNHTLSKSESDAIKMTLMHSNERFHTRSMRVQGDARVRSLQALRSAEAAVPLAKVLMRENSAPTAKQRLAALWHVFDWLMVGQLRLGF